jgi:superfamily II DNA or RNA helicase
VIIHINPKSIEDYKTFLAIKRLPAWRIKGREAWFPDEYAATLGINAESPRFVNWEPSDFLFDYQGDITTLSLRKRKFAIFADCGLGKTLIFIEYMQGAMQVLSRQNKGVLMVAPLMVVEQTISEARRFYPDLEIEQVRAKDLQGWLDSCGGKIGITNYEAIRPELTQGQLGGLVLDESSTLKSHYGKWGTKLIDLGRGLEWKLCGTGTPAPNDRIEYANHAVFLDHFPTVNSFLATFFINRGQTQERWVLKDHAVEPFYRALSHWCIFLSNPATYGWKDNATNIPPIHVHIHQVPTTKEQRKALYRETGQMFAASMGGIATRGKLGQIAKGNLRGKKIETNKPRYIKELVESWPDESTIIWCIYNAEQESMEATFPDAASIRGDTPHEKRLELIADFKAGRRKVLISKPKILGFGLNLQIATRQVFSGLQDSYESFYQAVKRSNRIGSTRPLNVHIPVTDLEEPMVQNVLRKSTMVQQDTEEQERIFKQCAMTY